MATSASSKLSSAVYAHSQHGSINKMAEGGSTSTSSASSSGDESGFAASSSSSTSTTPASSDAAAARPSLARFRWETDSWLRNGDAWDLSGAKELSNLVKSATAEAHRTVESSPMVG